MVTKAISTVSKSGLNFGDVVNGYFAVSDYKDARNQGDGVVKSTAKAGASFAWGEFFYGGMSSAISGALPKKLAWAATPAMFGLMLAPAAVQVAGVSMEQNSKIKGKYYNQRGKFGSGYFDMSNAGYTMRQRSLNAIHSNGLNTQSVLGNEARTYFRG